MQPLLQVAPSSSSGPAAVPKDSTPLAGLSEKETIAFMRDRIKSLEAELKSIKGYANVWKNKAKLALESEEYLLSQISDASEQLLGEPSCEPPSFLCCASLQIFP